MIGTGSHEKHPFNELSRIRKRQDGELDELFPFVFVVSFNFAFLFLKTNKKYTYISSFIRINPTSLTMNLAAGQCVSEVVWCHSERFNNILEIKIPLKTKFILHKLGINITPKARLMQMTLSLYTI